MANPNFVKGNKIGKSGRPKGAVNKEKKLLRKFLADVLDENQEKFVTELNKLKGPQYVNAFTTLLEYCTPKLQRAEIEQTTTIDLSLLSDEELRAVSALIDKVG